MKNVWKRLLLAGCMLASVALCGAVPELEKLVPSATGYELLFKVDPKSWPAKGYLTDRGIDLEGKIDRIGYLLKLTGKDGKVQWAFASMDAFTQDPSELGIPVPGGKVFQTYVKNLEVSSNVPGVKVGKFAQGNVEIWGNNYDGANAKNVPGAGKAFDFGDKVLPSGSFGCLQIHNYLEKQTVIAYNQFNRGGNSDLGIGNSPKGNPDWTFSCACKNWKAAELYVVAKGSFRKSKTVRLNADNCEFILSTDKDPLSYQPGETMIFTLTVVNKGPAPTLPYAIKYARTGDDGRGDYGLIPWENKPVTVRTSLEKPGFVRLSATVVDARGQAIARTTGKEKRFFVDGGAAVHPEKLVGTAEPADFDAFWAAQKKRLAAVPVKALEMKKLHSGKTADVYQVKVACAGPAPVTGYLTLPRNAKPKSCAGRVCFAGYGFNGGKDWIPPNGPANEIVFWINAHGYDLGRDAAYYEAFGKKIRTPKYGYAFSPEENKKRDTAYFNGMTLRVMRALEFVKSFPEYNGKLIAIGGSQGGLQTIWAAALDPDVTEALPGIPWCCDLGGVQNFRRLSAHWRIPYVPALEYYDPIHFAKRIRCKTIITRAGLGDYVCPPSGVAVFYNNLTCPKEIRWYQNSEHGYVPKNPAIFIRKSAAK